jgi:hypothetical protein
VWQEKVGVIVNLARLEGGFAGSCQYWPTGFGSASGSDPLTPGPSVANGSDLDTGGAKNVMRFEGPIRVELLGEECPVPGTTVRQLAISVDCADRVDRVDRVDRGNSHGEGSSGADGANVVPTRRVTQVGCQHSVNIQSTFSQHSVNIQSTFSEQTANSSRYPGG